MVEKDLAKKQIKIAARKAFRLKNRYELLVDENQPAYHIPFPDSQIFWVQMLSIHEFAKPDVIYCKGDIHQFLDLDFPITDIYDSVMSKKMFEIVKADGLPLYNTVPVVILDDTYQGNPLDSNGRPKEGVRTADNYLAVQLLEYTDAFDPAHSIYKKHLVFPDRIGTIEKLVFRPQPKGFPAMFRIRENRSWLFVNENTKQELEAAGITGCIFEPIEIS